MSRSLEYLRIDSVICCLRHYIQTAYPLRTGPMMAEWYRVVHTSRPAGRSSAVLACHANRALISRARRVSGQIRVVVSHAIWGYQIRWQIGYSSRSFLDVHPPDHRTSEDRPFQRPLLNTYYGYLGKQWEQLERRSSMVCMQYDHRSIPPRIPPIIARPYFRACQENKGTKGI